MSDRESVLAANRAFYDAFESLDAEKMEAVWLRDPRIICIHPGWRKLSGWGPIMSSWERILDNVFERVGNDWFMVMHHGSPVIAPPDDEPPLQ